MDKKITSIVEIILALVFVGLISTFFGMTMDIGQDFSKRMTDTKNNIAYAEYAAYDGKVVSGDTIISLISIERNRKNRVKMAINVVGSGNYGATAGGYVPYTATNPSDAGFINPIKEYNSELVYNTNKTLVGIKFTPTP